MATTQDKTSPEPQLDHNTARIQQQISDNQKYNQHLKVLIHSQEQKKQQLNQSINRQALSEPQLITLLYAMLDDLTIWLEHDLPILSLERSQRVTQLKSMLSSVELPISEKLFRLLDAWLIELEYGKNISTYSQEITVNSQVRQVTLIHLGRIGLYALTPNRQQAWLWQQDEKTWTKLQTQARLTLVELFQQEQGKQAPSLFALPLSISKPQNNNQVNPTEKQ